MKKLIALLFTLTVVCLPMSAATVKELFGTSNQSITCTITSLASTAYRQCAVVDNSTNLFLDALVTVKVKSNAASTSASGSVNVYAYGTTDGGTSYDGGASGSDASYTVDETPPNITLIGVLTLNTNATTVQRSFSVAAGFGNNLPQKWGIIIQNSSGATLDASVGSINYQGIQAQSQ